MRGWTTRMAAACGAGMLTMALAAGPAGAASTKTVNVKMIDHKFTGVPKTLSAGRTTFVIRNGGTMDHMAVLRR